MDVPVIGMNKMAFDELQSVKEMKIIPELPISLRSPESYRSHNLAIIWYKRHLVIKEMSS
jgi:hypothetical protein